MVKLSTQFTRFFWSAIVAVLLVATKAYPQVSLHPYLSSYSQNFDGLPASGSGTWEHNTQYFPGWYLFRTVPTTTTITAGTGSSNYGGLYSYGLEKSSDRALGSIASATSTVGEFAWGLLIQNNTGHTITSLNVNYTGEQWRSARPATPQHMLSFWYATGADPTSFNLSPKSDAGWTNVKELNFLGPVFYATGGPLNGNAPANRKQVSATIQVHVLPGHYVMLRWKDLDEFENDHGLAIDDFSMTWTTNAPTDPTPLPVELVSFSARQINQQVQLNWATASEKDNSHFIVERSITGKEFAAVATIEGKGTSALPSNYRFTDEQPVSGTAFYRLKQVDYDGTYSYSKVVAVHVKALTKALLYPTIATSILNLDLPEQSNTITIYDFAGRLIYHEPVPFQARKHTLVVSHLKAGNYSLLLCNTKGERQTLRFVKR
ncbi:T9SS type A sorting domain-containing protein [Pontibacter sp. Tf4]|uniref:T9SS type A sorting domain-containing protein n=1 Tax=Pontibacter sp. Tf4 TaxID=2761620 RepID=UPI0016241589|nr:T9SS type A sorting domain-containing protein [Pontibacter sp. Tf4]MBB6612090.1 T9SS type A sorting domain-containing protein [Pontibacter sp. Tf4]